jgi:Xylanase inhibitor C-terminal
MLCVSVLHSQFHAYHGNCLFNKRILNRCWSQHEISYLILGAVPLWPQSWSRTLFSQILCCKCNCHALPRYKIYPHDISGALILGDVPPDVLTALPLPIITPRSRIAPFYNVHISGVSLGKERLDIDLAPFEQSYGTIIDSGTTFTYLPSAAYKQVSAAVVRTVETIGLDVMLEETVGTYCFLAYAPVILSLPMQVAVLALDM